MLGDARHIPFASETFSHVYSIEAMVHVSPKDMAINEAFRVLRPGGVLCIQDPVHDPDLPIALFERTLFPLPIEEYESALDAAGFRDITVSDRSRESREAYELMSRFVPIKSSQARQGVCCFPEAALS